MASARCSCSAQACTCTSRDVGLLSKRRAATGPAGRPGAVLGHCARRVASATCKRARKIREKCGFKAGRRSPTTRPATHALPYWASAKQHDGKACGASPIPHNKPAFWPLHCAAKLARQFSAQRSMSKPGRCPRCVCVCQGLRTFMARHRPIFTDPGHSAASAAV